MSEEKLTDTTRPDKLLCALDTAVLWWLLPYTPACDDINSLTTIGRETVTSKCENSVSEEMI